VTWRRPAGRLAAGVTVAAIALFGWAPRANAETLPTLTIGLMARAGSLNPFTANDPMARQALTLAYEGLSDYDAENQPGPGLAASWSVSAGGLTWTYAIPAGRQWSDGQPVTAADAVYTFTALMTDTHLPAASRALAANVASVNAPDASTVVLTLIAPRASNPAVGIPIVPVHVWGGGTGPATLSDFANEPGDRPLVGSGPFVVAGRRADGGLDLRANPLFWGGASRLAGISLVPYATSADAWAALRAGGVDFVSGLAAPDFAEAARTPGIATSSGASRDIVAAYLNGTSTAEPTAGNPVLRAAGVREAIAGVIDPVALVASVFAGLGTPGVTGVPPAYPTLSGFPSGASGRAGGLARANDALAAVLPALGYARDLATSRWLDANAAPLTLRVAWDPADELAAQSAAWLAGPLRQLGFAAALTPLPTADLESAIATGDYDIYVASREVPPDPDVALAPYRCASPGADATSGRPGRLGLCDPTFDALADRQQSDQDPGDRARLIKQAYGTVYAAATEVVLYYPPVLEAWRASRFLRFTRVPAGAGPITGQLAYWGLFEAVPMRTGITGGTTGPTSVPGGERWVVMAVAGGVGALATVLLVVVLVLRRRGRGTSEVVVAEVDESLPHVGDFESGV